MDLARNLYTIRHHRTHEPHYYFCFLVFEFDHHFSLDKVNLGYRTSGLYILGVTTKAADYHYLDGVTLIYPNCRNSPLGVASPGLTFPDFEPYPGHDSMLLTVK